MHQTPTAGLERHIMRNESFMLCMDACLSIMHLLQPVLMLNNGMSVVCSSQASHLLLCCGNGMGLLQHVQLMLSVLNALQPSQLILQASHTLHYRPSCFSMIVAW